MYNNLLTEVHTSTIAIDQHKAINMYITKRSEGKLIKRMRHESSP